MRKTQHNTQAAIKAMKNGVDELRTYETKKMPSFSQKSLQRLMTCDERLQRIMNIVIQHMDITVLEGHRGKERQNKAYEEGKSKVKFPNSKHNKEPSMAVDVAPYPIDWGDKKRFDQMGHFVLGVAAGLGIQLEWGGNFKSFYDGPHFQIKET